MKDDTGNPKDHPTRPGAMADAETRVLAGRRRVEIRDRRLRVVWRGGRVRGGA